MYFFWYTRKKLEDSYFFQFLPEEMEDIRKIILFSIECSEYVVLNNQLEVFGLFENGVFRRHHCQMCFPNWKCLTFVNFLKVQHVIIGSGNGLAMNRPQEY